MNENQILNSGPQGVAGFHYEVGDRDFPLLLRQFSPAIFEVCTGFTIMAQSIGPDMPLQTE